jgi:hypothetical protein
MSRTPPDAHWTSTPKEAIRDNLKPIVFSLTPDVCKTPIGSATPPIPYGIVAYPDEAATDTYAQTVRFTGQHAMLLRSNTTCCHGDEPGTAKGVKSGTVGDICEPLDHSATVRAEGSPLIRHGDKYYMNKRNTFGQVQWIEVTETYGGRRAPLNQYAFLDTTGQHIGQTMTDAAPETTAPRPSPGRALRVLRVLRGLSGLGEAASALEMAQKIAENAQVRDALSTLNLDPSNPMDVLTARAYVWGKNMAPMAIPEVPFTGPGNEAAARAIADLEAANPGITGEAAAGDKEAREQIRQAVQKAIEVGTASAASQARITGEEKEKYRKKCEVGPYRKMRKICGRYNMQAHHIVPDWTLRYGSQEEDKKGLKRIPKAEGALRAPPSYNEGQTICVNGHAAKYDTEHNQSHVADKAIEELGRKSTPPFTAEVWQIKDLSTTAMIAVRPDCTREIMEAVEMEFAGVPPDQLLRAKKSLPLPENTVFALRSGARAGTPLRK